MPTETIELFDPQNMPLDAQFQVFHAAKIVIGPHGAGFANVIACQKDTKLIEVANEMPRNFFLELAAKLNLEMHLVLGKPPSVNAVAYSNREATWHQDKMMPAPQATSLRDSGVLVDIEEVVDLIEAMVGEGFDHLRTTQNEELGSKIFIADDGMYPVCCRNTTWNMGY